MSRIDDNTSLDDAVPSNSTYLAKGDVGEDGMVLTIAGFTRETIKSDNGEEEKTVLHFKEPGIKPMVLNVTNRNRIMECTGASTTGEAKGKRICVYNDRFIEFAGKRTGGLRIRDVRDVAGVARHNAANATRTDDGPPMPPLPGDDEIPF